jgi:methionine biosynthesis protein MetW
VLDCVQRGVNVVQRNLEEGLSLFDDNSFDVVLQLDTLQNLRNTEDMLRETARVGKHRHRQLPQLCALAATG